MDEPAHWGTLEVRFVCAEYDEAYLESSNPHTFCSLYLLEKVKWRRRKSRPRGRGTDEAPLKPMWDEAFTFEDVRSDSKLALDVWNVPLDASADEFFGKVTVVIAQALCSPVEAWHELLPGRVQIALHWSPQLAGDTLDLLARLLLSEMASGEAPLNELTAKKICMKACGCVAKRPRP